MSSDLKMPVIYTVALIGPHREWLRRNTHEFRESYKSLAALDQRYYSTNIVALTPAQAPGIMGYQFDKISVYDYSVNLSISDVLRFSDWLDVQKAIGVKIHFWKDINRELKELSL